MITQERLREVLAYDPNTGNFYWKDTFGSRAIKGKVAGHFHKKLGVHTRIDQKSYSNHHLAWLYMYGYKPKRIQHIDGNLYNNAISNLKERKSQKNIPLTQDELKKQLHYDPETGIFTWKINKANIKAGMEAGSISHGYRQITFNRKVLRLHRLAFLYMEGYLPENDVDHINRIKDDNRWSNLREVNRVCNSRNCNINKNNTSGITGVTWDTQNKKWCAQLSINKKNFYLGSFKTKFDAAKARWEAEKKYDFPECCSTSSAYLYLKEHDKKED